MPIEKPQDIEALKKRHKDLEHQKVTSEANFKTATDPVWYWAASAVFPVRFDIPPPAESERLPPVPHTAMPQLNPRDSVEGTVTVTAPAKSARITFPFILSFSVRAAPENGTTVASRSACCAMLPS